ncbi:SUF system Fe-S cluster assembly regulator [Arenibaculum sp.]|jgi:FeS assembly SUF system regulator|uniref:SUF system Fe-S cluster assembly regulator n=1 Tax=Arenibaculum sp. TaxID=2865862 RepID=UPI002E0F50E2|nr:SUF system Fe-S cluster assembly regulator [Arenibaculum sp.]
MIKLSKLTDYAVVVMAQMARADGGVHTVTQLAENTGVPAPTVAKLLKILAPAGLMVSHRGAAGGYALSRSAERITVADIISALEGPISITSCVEGAEGGCGVERLCPMRGNWDRVNAAVRAALESVTLADMSVHPPLPAAMAAPALRATAG